MLISTQRQIALRCPVCGQLEIHPLSLFNFSGSSNVVFHCSCGFVKLTMATRDHKTYSLQFTCMICDEIHILSIRHAQIWQSRLTPIACPASGQELGYIGDEEQLQALMLESSRNMESVLNDVGFDDFFTNPTIMVQVLSHLHQVAEEGHLYCQCGNKEIQVDVFPEKLELRCPRCNSLSIIYAENQEDLELVKNVRVIAMTEKGFTSFNAHKIPGEG
jgi:phage FluMu protein Com